MRTLAVTAKSLIVLPERVKRQLQAEEDERFFWRTLLGFSCIFGGLSALLPTILLMITWPTWLAVFFGVIQGGMIAMGIYAWLPLAFFPEGISSS